MQRLKSSMGPSGLSPDLHGQRDEFIVSIFFDSGGSLQQVSIRGGEGQGYNTILYFSTSLGAFHYQITKNCSNINVARNG